jgi:hypothetical protein
VPFESVYVCGPTQANSAALRDDGVIGIYIENVDLETSSEGASVCQVGGTVGAPERVSLGARSRNSDREAIVSSITAHEQP